MSTVIVSSGQTVSGLILSGGDYEQVLSGGLSLATELSGGGMETVNSGGVSEQNIVDGGALYVSGISSDDVLSAGLIDVLGVVQNEVINAGYRSNSGEIDVYEHGSAIGVTISQGELYIQFRGSASDVDLIKGRITVDGGDLSSATISGGMLNLDQDAKFSAITVSSGGVVVVNGYDVLHGTPLVVELFKVQSDGSTLGITALSGSHFEYKDITVDRGGVVEGSGQVDVLAVLSGGLATGLAHIEGELIVSAGGIVKDVGSLRELAFAYDYGIVSNATLSSTFASFDVFSGGVADDILIRAGGEFVSAGGVASGTRLIGAEASQQVEGVATATTLSDSSTQNVQGSALGVVLESGASQLVYSGGYSSGVALHGQTSAEDLGDEVDISVFADAVLTVGDIYESGSARRVHIFNGGQVDVLTGSISDVVVQSGGLLVLMNSATASYVTVRAGGTVVHDYDIRGGQPVSGITVSSGAYLKNEGVVNGATILSGAIDYNGDLQSGTIVSAGGQELVIGGIDTAATLIGVVGGDAPSSSRIGPLVGLQLVIDGVASRTTVSSGGYQRLGYDGASFSAGTAYDTTVLSGGVVEVDAEAALSGATIDSGGELLIYDHYQAITGIALKAGAVIALGDQDASSASFAGGKLVISSGGVAIESFTVSGGGAGLAVSVASGTDGQTVLTITSAATAKASLVEAAARFAGASGPFAGSSATSAAAHAGYVTVEPGHASSRHAVG